MRANPAAVLQVMGLMGRLSALGACALLATCMPLSVLMKEDDSPQLWDDLRRRSKLPPEQHAAAVHNLWRCGAGIAYEYSLNIELLEDVVRAHPPNAPSVLAFGSNPTLRAVSWLQAALHRSAGGPFGGCLCRVRRAAAPECSSYARSSPGRPSEEEDGCVQSFQGRPSCVVQLHLGS